MTIQSMVEGMLTPAQWAKAHHGHRGVQRDQELPFGRLESTHQDTMQQTAVDLVNWLAQHNQRDYPTQMDELNQLVQNAFPTRPPPQRVEGHV